MRQYDTLVSYFIMIFLLVNEWKTRRTAATPSALGKTCSCGLSSYSDLDDGMHSCVRLFCCGMTVTEERKHH